jgi:hypothetical protein
MEHFCSFFARRQTNALHCGFWFPNKAQLVARRKMDLLLRFRGRQYSDLEERHEWGPEIQITKNGGCNQLESPDGRYIYYMNKGDSSLWRVPVDGGEEVQLTELGPNSQFTVGKRGVYFIGSLDANTLKLMDYGTGSIKVLGKLPGRIRHGLCVSPDERWLLYAKGESEGSQLMLVEKFR